jgi:alkylation response protein AidB-like acyl-CoA dehydrogenase
MSLPDILSVARQLADELAAPEAEAVDQAAKWPEACLRALQRAGLGGLVVPTASGGLGQGLLALAQVCEVLGRRCGSTALCYGMHCVGTAVLAAKATPEQVERYLVPICEGRHITTLALSEPGTGSHFYLPQSRLTRQSPELFLVNGTKAFVTNGAHADSYVVSTASSNPRAAPGQFSCVAVRAEAPGLRWHANWEGWGMRGNAASTLELRDTPVPSGDLLGREGDEIWYLFHVVVPYFLMAMAGTYVGIADAALEEARMHLLLRRNEVTGVPLAGNTLLQHRFGRLWAQVERTRQLLYTAGAKGDAGSEQALPMLLSVKAEAGECAVEVANEAMTLMGGLAYRNTSRIQRLLRDARAAHVMSPTTDILRSWTGRVLLGQPLLGE